MKWLILWAVTCGMFLALLLLPAQRVDWPAAYAAVGLLVTGWVLVASWVRRQNPALFERRSQTGFGTPEWDKKIVLAIRYAALSIFLLAGFDSGREARFPELWSAGLGVVLYLSGLALFAKTITTNPFFEGMVRHQVEQGHRVIREGPYARVRHPGYVAFLLIFAALPCLLGSAWALAGTGALLGLFMLRIVKEERLLADSLSGYKDYQASVRYRLLPGVW
jgi:protein-S-isoprenylcysteine O-methyltransferase Ste14